MVANNKNVADLRRNALHVVRQVAESGAGKISNPAPLIFHAVRIKRIYVLGIEVHNFRGCDMQKTSRTHIVFITSYSFSACVQRKPK